MDPKQVMVSLLCKVGFVLGSGVRVLSTGKLWNIWLYVLSGSVLPLLRAGSLLSISLVLRHVVICGGTVV